MPDSDKPIRRATPPPSGRSPRVKAPGVPDPEDAPDRVESTEPDDDLSSYVVPPDPEPETPPVDAVPPAPGSNDVGPQFPPDDPREGVSLDPAGPRVTTADTELVRQLEAELARARARLAGQEADVSEWSAGPAPLDPKPGDKVLVHVREDGFTINGRVWYRGQELEFTVGEPNWQATCDINGKSWLLMTESEQIRRYGQIMFGHGPWPGLPFEHDRAAEAERRRGRTAPAITQLSSQKQLRN